MQKNTNKMMIPKEKIYLDKILVYLQNNKKSLIFMIICNVISKILWGRE